MSFRIIYAQSYLKRAAKFIKRHPDLLPQYEKTLKLLELNPSHPSLRLHRLGGPPARSPFGLDQYQLPDHLGVPDRRRDNRIGECWRSFWWQGIVRHNFCIDPT